MAAVSPGGAVVRSAPRMTGAGRSTDRAGTTHFRFRSGSGSQAGLGAGRQLADAAPLAAQHEDAARLRWGRRETAELRIATRKLGSPEAFPESLRVLRSETESGPRAPRQGNEGFSKNKSENTNPHHSRITYAVSFNIIL